MRRALPSALALVCLALALPPAAAQETGSVDLRLRIDFLDAEAHAGDVGSFGFNVTNEGGATATGVTIALVMPDGMTFESGHRCATTDGRTATCSGEDLPPASTLGYSFDVRFDEEGEGTITGTVASDQPDSDGSDNAAEKTVTVAEARPNPPVEGVACLATEDGILVSWGVNDFVIEYRVYRSRDGGEPTFLASGVQQSHLDATAEADATYAYFVTAVRSHGETGLGEGCSATAIPEFPSVAAAAAAGAVAAAAFVALRRRG